MVDACAWESDKELVPQEQIAPLLGLLLEAENRTWLASISPVNSSEHDSLKPQENGKPGCCFTDVGSHLLRHGQRTDEIHRYFHKLEPNHYCLKATTNDKNPDRPSSQVKVVSNDDSLTDSTRTMSSDSCTAQGTNKALDHKHLMFEPVYKNALLCAKYPVLSVSEPASPSTPYSPTSSTSDSSFSVKHRRFSFSKVPNPSYVPSDTKLTSDSFAMSASSDGRASSEVSFSNLSDTLQELVMKLFSLKKKEQQYLTETVIPQQVPQSKDPPRLLMETLLSQRVVLERNHHRFYSVQAFMDKNAYSEWVRREKDKIECLINSFWHKAYPPVPELPLEDQGFHRQYVDLMERLFSCESKNKELHPVHRGVTPTSPLSSSACQLLKEFQLRYGIGLLYCKISYLDYLVKYLENDVWYLYHVADCLHDLMRHVTYPEIFVESEFKMLLSILSNLLAKTKYALTGIRKIFPENSPNDGVPALVTLFRLSLESSRHLCTEFPLVFSTLHQAHVFASNLPIEPLGDILASYLKTEMNSRYERLKVIAIDQLGQDCLSPRLMIKLILEIRLEVKDYDTFYNVAFCSYFDVRELAAFQFYSLLMSDVEQLCANPPRACGNDDVEPNMLCLAFRLSKLDKDWAKFIPFSRQIWRQPFQDFTLQWLDAIGCSLRTLVPKLTRVDEWRAVEGTFSVSQKRLRNYAKNQGKRLPPRPMETKSASLGSLTHSQNSAFNSVGPSPSGLTKTMERKACGRKGKEPLRSRKDTLGSTPMAKNRGPKPNRTGMVHASSSSDEDTSVEGTSSPSKASYVQEVVVQIHEPRTRAGRRTDSAKASSEANGIGPSVCSVGSQQTLEIDGNLRDAVEQNAISISNASLDKNCVPQLPASGSHSEDAFVEKANNTEQQSSTSASSENVNPKRERGNDEEGFTEDVFRSDCPRNSSSSRTPFENDSTGESDGETVFHSVGSKPTEVSADGGSDGSNSLLYSYRQEPQEDHIKVESKLRPAPASSVVSGAQPIEDGGISSDAKGSCDSCESCPSKDICVKRDKRKERASSCIVVGSGSNNLKAAPIIIPAASSNKCIAQQLETPGGSIGSALSDCYTFVSAPGSFMSGNSVQTFHTASSHHSTSSKNSADLSDTLHEPQADQLAITGDTDDQTGSHQSTDNASKVLPISSSFVDVVCAVNRLASFVCHLCEILCPDESKDRDENTDDELKSESLEIKRRLCYRLFQVILAFVKLYSDNVLGMEVCGLPQEDLVKILDERVWRHLTLQREAGQLQGCRYNASARQCCNKRDNNGMFIPPCEAMSRAEENPGQYEPVTQQMGVRISNVAILRGVLPWLAEHVVTVVNNPESLLSTHEYFESSVECEVSFSLSYCENGPSLDGVTNSTAAEADRCEAPQSKANELYDQGILNGDLEHFCRLETAQVKLVSYRINKFFKQVLGHLLNLNLPRYDIRKRLKPAMDFLSRELRRIHVLLYPDCFNKLLTNVWAAVTENFEEELQRLFSRRSSASEHSKVLLQAVAYLIQFFHAEGIGLACDTLAAPLDPTVKHMQLYTSPTDKLISMYHSLYKQVLIMQRQYRVDERTSSASVSSHQASANAPADFVVQALCRDLHKTRKCFTGAQLVDWVKDYVQHAEHALENLGVCIGNTDTETGLELGQYLLEHGVIICISPPPLFNQQRTPGKRNEVDETMVTDSMPKERGKVFVRGVSPPDIRINNITVSTRNARGSPQSDSRSTSRSTTVNDSESQDEADDEYEEDDDFLGSGSDLLTRTNSALSERSATFYNHHKAFYKFVCEEDSSRTEIKITLGFSDRLKLPAKLKNILCVLYTRKNSDRSARKFLKRLPRQLLEEAIGEERIMCYGVFRACQTL